MRGRGWIVLLNLRRMGLGGDHRGFWGRLPFGSALFIASSVICLYTFYLMLNDSPERIPISNR